MSNLLIPLAILMASDNISKGQKQNIAQRLKELVEHAELVNQRKLTKTEIKEILDAIIADEERQEKNKNAGNVFLIFLILLIIFGGLIAMIVLIS